jgi:beta-lactam-binding protein with PASTA domain
MAMARLTGALLLLLLALAVTGCGGDDDDENGITAATTAAGQAATVPDVEGTTLTEAAQQLGQDGLRVAVEYVPSEQRAGNVTGQDRPAGTELQRGDSVGLSVSTGPSPAAEVPVPDALDKTAAEGQAVLERAGFEVLAIPLASVTEDRVIYHSPAGGTRIPRGSLVVLYHGG